MNKTISVRKYIVMQLLLCFCIITSAQQYGTDNILNFYTVEKSIYIPFGQKVIYQDFDTRMEIEVDSSSFVSAVYPSVFAFDKNGIYYKGKLVDTDTTGFRYFSDIYTNEKRLHIWKNKNHVYASDSILTNIDAITCVWVVNGILRDKNGQYENFEKITNNRRNKELLREYPKGSEGITYMYLTDYFRPATSGYMFDDIDKESFEVLGLYYVKDKNGVYFFDEVTRKLKKIEGAYKDSFKDISNLNGCLAYDKYFVYLKDKRLDGITGYNVQVLGVYMGYRSISEFDSSPVYNYFLIKDPRFYWMVSEHQIFFLGEKYPQHIINRSQKGKRILTYM